MQDAGAGREPGPGKRIRSPKRKARPHEWDRAVFRRAPVDNRLEKGRTALVERPTGLPQTAPYIPPRNNSAWSSANW